MGYTAGSLGVLWVSQTLLPRCHRELHWISWLEEAKLQSLLENLVPSGIYSGTFLR